MVVRSIGNSLMVILPDVRHQIIQHDLSIIKLRDQNIFLAY
jgi:hypothetical protein